MEPVLPWAAVWPAGIMGSFLAQQPSVLFAWSSGDQAAFLCSLSSCLPKRSPSVRSDALPVLIISPSAGTAEAVRRGGWITKIKEFGMRPATSKAWEGTGDEGGRCQGDNYY